MPSTSKKQARFMAAIAHSPSFAKKVGVPQSVGEDFNAADKGRKFGKGGTTKQKINRQDTRHGKIDMPFTDLNKHAGMKGGGSVKGSARTRKFAGGGGITDRQTRLAQYEKLSPKKKAEVLKAHEKDVSEAEAGAKRPLGSRVVDAYYEMNPLVSERERKQQRENAAADTKLRTDKLGRAQEALKSLGKNKAYYSDDVLHTINPDDKMFRKGGSVKESKGMVGKEIAFFKKKGAPASMIKHEKAEMGMKKGGMARGGGIESKGKTKGTMIKMAAGGAVKGFARGGGIEVKGKTKGKFI